MKKSHISLHLVIILFSLVLIPSLYAQKENSNAKKISGVVTHLGQPLKDVNIVIENKSLGTQTNSKGEYAIDASIGDIILYSYVGYNTVSIIVEDVTSVLNIELKVTTNILDEAIVKAKKNIGSVLDKIETKKIQTAAGRINPTVLPSTVRYFQGKDLPENYPDLRTALKSMMSNVPSLFDIDGTIYKKDFAPNIPFSEIEDLYVVTGSAGTMRWGGPVIIVRTIYNKEVIAEKRKKTTEKYANQNFYNNDAINLDSASVVTSSSTFIQKKEAQLKIIKGKVTFEKSPLTNAHISIGTKTTKTDANGEYIIKGEVGDIIDYSHIGFKTVSIIIEDITNVLNINMRPQVNILDESIVKGTTKKGEVLKRAELADEEFTTAMGKINPKKAGYAISYVDGKEINQGHASLIQALAGKAAGVIVNPLTGEIIIRTTMSIQNSAPPLWDIDGMIFTSEPQNEGGQLSFKMPPIDLSNIKDIHIIKSLAGTTRYGSMGRGGVIVVRTNYGTFGNKKNKINQQYTNQNYYADDAANINFEISNGNHYLRTFTAFSDKNDAYTYYDEILKSKFYHFGQHISIAQKFLTHFEDQELFNKVLEDLSDKHKKNAEILKAIAYEFQTFNKKKKAIKTYEAIFRLRPNYAQTYRDLANAYLENEQFQKAWRLYMNYLLKGNKVNEDGIGKIIYNEMEWLYFSRNNQTAIKQRFVPLNKTVKDFRNDVRMVFEWSTSEAEFDLEFVGPDKRVYTFEHSLDKNKDQIIEEKRIGYSSREFFIEDIKNGEWLANLTYFGNKKPEPTYLKLTVYYNWGKHNQRRETKNYMLQDLEGKIQLYKINQQSLLTAN